jgi:hypothetical protein
MLRPRRENDPRGLFHHPPGTPITAVWAVALGSAMSAAALVLGTGSPGRRPLLLYAGIGVLLGTLPYFLLALLQA